ncbi:hypothetical protein JTB14_037342 [Gonioctena quinquepunctata]|nr:hypothetical protein JTB14_037342 [Gonioctena quinquepunctata]
MGLGNITYQPIDIFCDNEGATELSKNNVFHARSKHIDIRHHFVRDAVENGNICVKPIETENMPADILTKITSQAKFVWCIQDFGLM